MANLTILRTYALAAELPPTVLFSKTSTSITIYDAFPKSIFHLLVLPRVQPDFSLADLSSLRSLLRGDKEHAQRLLLSLKEDAAQARKEIESEMVRMYGFKWPIWTGFHGAPSMEHLHLHVISADLCSDKMKHKKHYNSFHPKLNFFLDLDQVLSWFDAEPSYFTQVAKLDPKTYEPLLKEPLVCWHCDSEMKNMPSLKAHLQEEWDKISKRELSRADRKRKLEESKKMKISEE